MDLVLDQPNATGYKEPVYKKSDFLGYSLYTGDVNHIRYEQPTMINTINPHSFCIAQKDKIFREALQSSDILVPDGIGIVWAKRFLSREKIKRIAGMDIFLSMLEAVEHNPEESKKRIFFLGSTTETLTRLKAKITKEYPSLIVEYYSPPFVKSFSYEDNEIMLTRIREFKPFFLFVGMTAPKQEKWSYQNRSYICARAICNIGAVFDFYAETIRRPGPFWIDFGLEWLGRFMNEPRRLWRRVLISAPKFITTVVQSKIHSLL